MADFEAFLSGQRAPALVGPSLTRILKAEARTVSQQVVQWSLGQPDGMFTRHLLQARRKLFDVFFYRIVRPETIYKFFPEFEKHLLEQSPPDYQEFLTIEFEANPWQNIRPLGEMKTSAMMAAAPRTRAEVGEERFNENVYKNVTHELLSVQDRYEFADARTGALVFEHTAKVSSLFQDFTDLVQDKQARKEIVITNEADQGAYYESRPQFDLESYFLQSLDLVVAFFNDDFLLQSVRLMELLSDLAREKQFDLSKCAGCQAKQRLLKTQKLEEYTGHRTQRLLVKQVLLHFNEWQPARLLDKLLVEPTRRTRKVLLNVLENYGNEIYGLLLSRLDSCTGATPWYFIRNLIYLMGRIVAPDDASRERAIQLIDLHLVPESARQVILQCLVATPFIGTGHAATHLIKKLALFEKRSDVEAADIARRIALALAAVGTAPAMRAALDHTLGEWDEEFTDRCAQTSLTPDAAGLVIGLVEKELRKMRFSFSLLGSQNRLVQLLQSLTGTCRVEVADIGRKVANQVPLGQPAHQAAEELLVRVGAAPVLPDSDPTLRKLAQDRSMPEVIHHLHEARLSGFLQVHTSDGMDGVIEFRQGQVPRAGVRPVLMDGEAAFHWLFLLEPGEIDRLAFSVSCPAGVTLEELATPAGAAGLIRDALLRKGEVRQIQGTNIRPESRFSQRRVAAYFLQFKGADQPELCLRIWDALRDNPDVAALTKITQLGKYEVYKSLFFMLRHNMIEIDAHKRVTERNPIEDGIDMLGAYLERIAKRPVFFNNYRSAAEVCDSVSQSGADEVVAYALGLLREFFWNAFAGRRAFSSADIGICTQFLRLLVEYLRGATPENKDTLLNYIRFTFQVQEPAGAAPPPVPEATILLKLENLDLGGDVFDEGADRLFDDDTIDGFLDDLDAALTNITNAAPEAGPRQDSGLTEGEQVMLMNLYDNIASAYVKPLKDFIREIQLNQKIRKQTSKDWLDLVEPSIRLLSGSADKMGGAQICRVLEDLKTLIEGAKSAGVEILPEAMLQGVLGCHARLVALLPRTFSLEVTEEDISSKKETLITKFILRQVPELTEKQLNRIILAGLSTFDKFMHSSPDEIAAVTGIPLALSEEVFMKFYQYRHIYYRPNDEEYREKFFRMFEVKLKILREIHQEIERLAAAGESERAAVEKRRETLQQERQQTLGALFILLCIQEEFDLMESIQQAIYDVRIQRLEEYLARLADGLSAA